MSLELVVRHKQEKTTGDTGVTVKVKRDIYNRLQDILKRKQMTGVKNTLNQMAKNYVIKEEIFQRYCPFLSVISVEDNSMYIKDDKKNAIAEVRLKYKDEVTNAVTLECQLCKTDYCVHTAFATATDKLGELEFKTK